MAAESSLAAPQTGPGPPTPGSSTPDTPSDLPAEPSGAHTLTPGAPLRTPIRPNPFRHWLFTVNSALGVFLFGAFAASSLAAVGLQPAADWLYAVYHFTCHQWAFRSFFLFGADASPVTVYDQLQLAATTDDPFGFLGNAQLGWKMAFCERDLAIY